MQTHLTDMHTVMLEKPGRERWQEDSLGQLPWALSRALKLLNSLQVLLHGCFYGLYVGFIIYPLRPDFIVYSLFFY
jgi:hypothetical protein